MIESGFATPSDLSMLATAVDEFCSRHGVAEDDREDVARKVMSMFQQGIMDQALIARLLDPSAPGS